MAKTIATQMTDGGGSGAKTVVNSSYTNTNAGAKSATPIPINTSTTKPANAGSSMASGIASGLKSALTGLPTSSSSGSGGVSANPGMTSEAYHALNSTPKTDTPKTDTPKTDKPTSTPSYYPSGGGTGGGGGTPSGGGSTTPAEPETPVPTTADKYAQAASTVSRITQGVDMSEKIKEANDIWTEINEKYANSTQPMIDNAGNDMGQAIDTYAQESKEIIDGLKGLSDDAIAAYARDTGDTIDNVKLQINQIISGLEGIDEAEVGRVGNIDTIEEENLLKQITNAAGEQQMNRIDYTTQQGITELQRAEEDAAPQFQTMRNQIAANEQQALDNQALYAETRGDRGGIGQAQYAGIQNTAAVNTLTVNREQTKLATDTARQIADLRAQGEFKKADALLELTQSYLSQLMDLKKWGTEMNVGIDEFNIGVDEWEEEFRLKARELLADTKLSAAQYEANLDLGRAKDIFGAELDNAQQNAQLNLGRSESLNQQRQQLTKYMTDLGIQNAQYMSENQINQIVNVLNQYIDNAKNQANTELSAANLTGVFSDNTPTMAMDAYTQEQLKAAAEQLFASGLDLTDEQIAALGWTKDQYNSMKAKRNAGGSGGGDGGFSNSWYATVARAWHNTGEQGSLSSALKDAHNPANYAEIRKAAK